MRFSFIDLFFPRRSLLGTSGTWATPQERRMMQGEPFCIDRDILSRCGLTALDRLAVGTDYRSSPVLKIAIHAFKYHRIVGLADAIADVADRGSVFLDAPPGAVLCPVPLHWTRRFSRGFNQAQLIAERLPSLRLPVVRLLRRSRPTGHQVGRERVDRMTALGGAFRCIEAPPHHVILIDDVSTTGATLDACARALKEGGAQTVQALVAARA